MNDGGVDTDYFVGDLLQGAPLTDAGAIRAENRLMSGNFRRLAKAMALNKPIEFDAVQHTGYAIRFAVRFRHGPCAGWPWRRG